MSECKFTRKGKTIINLKTGEVKAFDSINQAKRESRKTQMEADGAIGRGTLRLA